MFTAYALYNQMKDKIYIGQAKDLEIRLARHNKKLPNKKSSFTAKNDGEWIVVHQERFLTRQEVLKREKQLKTAQGRKFIWNKIKLRANAPP